MEKNKNKTKQKILDALDTIISSDGFEKVGVNIIASKAGVSKILIYRYFGSLDNLILEFLAYKDAFNSSTIIFPSGEDHKDYIKTIFHNQISQLRNDQLSQKLNRWELYTQNGIVDKMRLKRESQGVTLVTIISQLTKHTQTEVAALASILSTSISYLILLSQHCPIYNGIDLQTDKGWEQIKLGVDLIIDKCFE